MDHKDRMRKMIRYVLKQSAENSLPILVEQPGARTPNERQMDFWSWAEKEYESRDMVIPLLVSLVDSGLISARVSTAEIGNGVWVNGVYIYGVTFDGYKFHIFE